DILNNTAKDISTSFLTKRTSYETFMIKPKEKVEVQVKKVSVKNKKQKDANVSTRKVISQYKSSILALKEHINIEY
ncbi:1993_t:CDS:2, partial [Funneliformis caledonium]